MQHQEITDINTGTVQNMVLVAPVDIHGMGNGEDNLSSVDAHTATKIFEQGSRQGSGPTMSCFDLLAGLWVFMYERSVPHAQKEVEQNCLLDDLHASTQRLKTRRDEIQSRVRQQVLEAKRVQARRDPRAFRNRMIGIRRLRTQVDRIDTSIMAIENNVDEIVNTDVTKDIVESLKRSTQAMKNKGFNIGGPEGVQDTMDELQNELQSCQVCCPLFWGETMHDYDLIRVETNRKSQTPSTRVSTMQWGRLPLVVTGKMSQRMIWWMNSTCFSVKKGRRKSRNKRRHSVASQFHTTTPTCHRTTDPCLTSLLKTARLDQWKLWRMWRSTPMVSVQSMVQTLRTDTEPRRSPAIAPAWRHTHRYHLRVLSRDMDQVLLLVPRGIP